MHKSLAQIKTAFGFTLIELIIAIVIVVILTTIGVAGFNSASRTNAVRQQAQEIKSLARKLRTDASAAIKPSGDCSLAANNASIYGTYLNFVQNDTKVTYGIMCFNQGSGDYSTQNTKTLPTGLILGSNISGYQNFTVFYSFNGDVAFYLLPVGTYYPSRDEVENNTSSYKVVGATRRIVVISDGTTVINFGNGNRYSVGFSITGLVCDQKYPPGVTCYN